MRPIFALKFFSIFQSFLHNMQLRGSNDVVCFQNNRDVTKKRKNKGKNLVKNHKPSLMFVKNTYI